MDVREFDKRRDELTVEELEAIIRGADVAQAPPGRGAEVLARRNAAAKELAALKAGAPPLAEQLEPNPLNRFMAGMGGELYDMGQSALDKFRLAFPGEGDPGAANFNRAVDERVERRNQLRELKETPAGQAGAFAGKAAPFMAGPMRVLPQMAIAAAEGVASGGPDRPENLTQEVMGSGLSGASDAVLTGAGLKLAQGVGRAANAARGAYTAEGERLLDLDRAAQRAGLRGENALGLGQLEPQGSFGRIEQGLPSYGQRVRNQADAVEQQFSTTRQVPNPAGGTTEQVVPGGLYAQGLEDAVRARQAQASQMYRDVEQFAQQNGLQNIDPVYSVPQLLNLQRHAVAGDEASAQAINLMNAYDPRALEWLGNSLAAGMTPAAIRANGIGMGAYHEMRVAANKAISALGRVRPAMRTAVQNRTLQALTDLRDGLDNEAQRWATQNAGNAQAMALYDRAREFYANVAAPAVVSNPLARKAISPSNGFETARARYSAVTNPANAELVDRLVPTMSPDTADMTRVLRELPDIGRAVATGHVPQDTGRRGTGALLAGLGHPVAGLLEVAPGANRLLRSEMAKRIFAARDPLRGSGPLGQLGSRVLAGSAQYPLDDLEDSAQRISGRK